MTHFEGHQFRTKGNGSVYPKLLWMSYVKGPQWTNTTLTECHFLDDEGPGLANAKAGAGQDGGAAVQGPKPGVTAGK